MTVKHTKLFFLLLLWFYLLAANHAGAAVEIVVEPNGKLSLNARESSLAEVVRYLSSNYSINVTGLENREDEKITFSYSDDSLENLLKGLLRYIGIKNYAFEFADATLKRLVVVPEASSNTSSASRASRSDNSQNEFVSIAEVRSIVEASQAESAGLQEGDIILEYDGVPISSAQQLVSEVKKKAANSQIEMVIVRQKIPTRMILSGGFIGVRITTRKIPRSEFESYQ
jgi:C-terminal processing protease CtpA/Prc